MQALIGLAMLGAMLAGYEGVRRIVLLALSDLRAAEREAEGFELERAMIYLLPEDIEWLRRVGYEPRSTDVSQ